MSNAPIEKATIDLLAKQPDYILALWWCKLNKLEWPHQIPNPEPVNAERPNRRGALMDWICVKIGIKECLRCWNRESMSHEVFEAWWESRSAVKQ